MNKEEPKVLTRMRLSCCWGDNLNKKELNEVVDYINSLQQENKQLKEINEQHRILNGELRTTINKAIEMFESDEHFEDGCYCEEIERLLKGDSNEN